MRSNRNRQWLVISALALMFLVCPQELLAVDEADAPEIKLALPALGAGDGVLIVYVSATGKTTRVPTKTREITLKKGEWLHFSTTDKCVCTLETVKALASVASRLRAAYFNSISDEHFAEVVKLTELRKLMITMHPDAKASGLEVLSKLENLAELEASFADGQDASGLKYIGTCKNVRSVFLMLGRKATDASLTHLEAMPRLESLSFQDWPGLTDAGMKSLAKIAMLKELDVRRCAKITGAGLAVFKGSKLSSFNLTGCDRVGDEGCKQLANMSQLTTLSLAAAGVSDKGVKTLTALEKLEVLMLDSNFDVTDACSKDFAAFKNLKILSIADNEFTDKSLPELKKLTQLQALNVARTSISFEGLEDLEETLKKTTVLTR